MLRQRRTLVKEFVDGSDELLRLDPAPLLGGALYDLDQAFALPHLADDHLHGDADQIRVLELAAWRLVAVIEQHVHPGLTKLPMELLAQAALLRMAGVHET